MKRFITLFLLSLTTTICFGQINPRGVSFIRNFTPEEYDATVQNWSVVQDNRGVMYFGNNDDGVLEYDGKTWRQIPVLNKAIVRSLAVDTAGTIYVGTQGDFGKLVPDENGILNYYSLAYLIKDSIEPFSDIWKTFNYKGCIYYYSKLFVFKYNGKSIDVLDIGPNTDYYNNQAFICNNRFYIGSYKKGLREVIDTAKVIAPNGDFFTSKNIWAIIAASDSTATVVSDQGLFSYNQNSGKASLLEHNDKFFKKTTEDAIPYYGIGLNDSNIGIAYVAGENFSFAKVSQTGEPIELINKKNYGLQDESVLSLFQKKTENNGSAPLWLSLNSGISRADIHSPFRRLGEESGLRGGILDIISFNNTIFVATFSGVFYLTYNINGIPHFVNLSDIAVSSWKFLVFKDPKSKKESLLVAGDGAIYQIDNNFNVLNISQEEGFKNVINHVGYYIHQSEKNPEIVNIAGRGGIAQLEWKDNKWVNRDFLIKNYLPEGRKVAEDNDGNLWLSTYIHGLKRMSSDGSQVTDFDTQHGLPDLKENYIFIIDDRILVATSKGLKQYNPATNYFDPASLFGEKSSVLNFGIPKMTPYQNGYILSVFDGNHRRIEFHRLNEKGEYEVSDAAFKPISSKIPDVIYADEKGILWFGISTDLVSYDPSVPRNYNEDFNVLIRKVTTKGDSVLFSGTYYSETPEGERIVSLVQNPKQIPTLPFSLNRFVFDVAAPFFENEDRTEYSYILEGNDKEWTKWEINPQPIYTNVREGEYTFKVKARNVFGVESKVAEYSFSITPPWYRSIVALISYVLLLAGFIWAIVVLNTRRLIAEKEHLEQIVKERTAEVVAQKEELEKQRDKIFEQNEEIKSSINYASRIQTALLTPIETLNEMFEDYFILYLPRDIVSGDFYWQTKIGNRKICVVADCTGHGVPGGFMSMLGMGFLTQIAARGEKLTASQILDQLRAQIITSLHQTGKSGENKDGMDLALYIIDSDTGMLEYSGANNPLIIIRDNEVIQVKADKMPIGIHIRCDTPFTNNVMEYKKGDMLYTFSDGYVDQFGGPDLRKFMIKNLKDLLLVIHHKPMAEQREILHKNIVDWQGESPRIDDIVLMGVRL